MTTNSEPCVFCQVDHHAPGTPVCKAAPRRCTHYDCRCARARELAEMGRTAEAVEVHRQEVRCRRPAI
jgi:hypothetical protein